MRMEDGRMKIFVVSVRMEMISMTVEMTRKSRETLTRVENHLVRRGWC